MVSITLPQELEQIVARRAAEQRTTPELLLLDDLNRLYAPPADAPRAEGQTLAEYWADYIGSIDSGETGSGDGALSENTGRQFAELMVQKYRKGSL